jgi:hypothetical protein
LFVCLQSRLLVVAQVQLSVNNTPQLDHASDAMW